MSVTLWSPDKNVQTVAEDEVSITEGAAFFCQELIKEQSSDVEIQQLYQFALDECKINRLFHKRWSVHEEMETTNSTSFTRVECDLPGCDSPEAS